MYKLNRCTIQHPLKTTKFSLYKGKYISKSFPYPPSILVLASLFLFLLSSLIVIQQTIKKIRSKGGFFLSVHPQNPTDQSIPSIKSNQKLQRVREKDLTKMSASSTAFSPDHLSPSEQLCYVHCNFCDTVLAVPPYLLLSLSESLYYFMIYPFAPTIFFLFFFNGFLYVLGLVFLCVFRWVFLALVCSRPSQFDVVTAPTSSLWTCVAFSFLQLTSFILVMLSSVLLKIFRYIYKWIKHSIRVSRIQIHCFCCPFHLSY